MTRAHRQRHRQLWIALAVLLPVVFIVGLLARRPVPVMSATTQSLAPQAAGLSSR
jgi:hypothetical protein